MKEKIQALLLLQKPWFRRISKFILIGTPVSIVLFIVYIISVGSNLFGLFGEMPETKDLENPERNASSEIISADGVSMGYYFRFNPSLITYDDLSPDLVNTLLISEDHRFREHSGLDFTAFLRVVKGLLTLSVGESGGGSTLTQQLAKNLFTISKDHSLDGPAAKLGTYPRRIIQKTKEWIIAVDLERRYTKEEIIAMYLNTVSFSHNAYGIKLASETYFNKQPKNLNILESAMLVGMLQNPVVFNPVNRPENALSKRNDVLNKLYAHRYRLRTRAQYDSASSLPIALNFSVRNHHKGIAPYFRTALQSQLLAWCKENNIDLWNSGLKVHTSIDSRMQLYAERAVAEHMKFLQTEFNKQWKARNRDPWTDVDGNAIEKYIDNRIQNTPVYRSLVKKYGKNSDSVNIVLRQKKKMQVFAWGGPKTVEFNTYDSLDYYKRFLHCGMMAMDPHTGQVKAWVGGIDHRYFEYDHVRLGKRQPGSVFKAFIYGLAMENGYAPCYKLNDTSPEFNVNGRKWSPRNDDGTLGDGALLTLRQGIAKSRNTIAAQLLKMLTAENVIDFSRRLGVTSKLDPVPSLCLGTYEVSLFEMVKAYSAFANEGLYQEPVLITRIEDKHGSVLASFTPKVKQAISAETAYKIIHLLKGGVEEEGGTSARLSRSLTIGNEVAAKTGTTNDASDGWYLGITPNLVTGVWVGGDEPSIHFPTLNLGQGSQSALPIWDKFMTSVYNDPATGVKKGYFKTPPEPGFTKDCKDYKDPEVEGDVPVEEED